MNMSQRPSALFAWECHVCHLGIRTRDFAHTIREARWHCWDLHRMAMKGHPRSVPWDHRIQGKRVLFTEWTGGEV